MDFVNQLAYRMELADDMSNFVVLLLELSNKQRGCFTRADVNYFDATLQNVRTKLLASDQVNESSALITLLKSFQK